MDSGVESPGDVEGSPGRPIHERRPTVTGGMKEIDVLKYSIRSAVVVAMTGVVGLGACADGPVGPGEPLPEATARAIADFVLSVDATGGWSTDVLAQSLSGTRAFERSTRCPAGGTQTVSGSGASSVDVETRTVLVSWTTTQTQTGCSFAQRGGGENITIDGTVSVTGSGTYRVPEDRGAGRTILAYNSKRTGSTTTVVGDRSRTCAIDVTETYDPVANTFRVVGSVCGRDVTATRPLR